MVRTLQQAIAAVSDLPHADQEEIGRKLLSHVEKLHRLREDIDAGLRSLDEGEAEPVDIEAVIRRMNRAHGAG